MSGLARLPMLLARYFLPGGSVTFWHTPVHGVAYDYSRLEDYYIDFTSKTAYAGPFDPDGIPLLDYRGSIGRQYNPCAVAQYALGWFSRWKRGEPAALAQFLKCADWLVRNLEETSAGGGRWPYRFDLDAYGALAPWISALAQAQGISVLLRAHIATGMKQYIQCSERACVTLLSPVDRGGVLLREGRDVYLEEVVAGRKTAILDGFVFSIFGLQDYVFTTGDEEAGHTLVQCIDTLERRLPEYELGYWSRADLYHEKPRIPASWFYHGLHVAQLEVLARLTGRRIFAEYAARWRRQQNSWISRMRALASKTYFKLMYY